MNIKNFKIFQESLKVNETVEPVDELFMMPLKVSMIMMSHLSDIGEGITNPELNQRCNFIKFLIMKYPDTNVEVDPNEEWSDFITKHPQFA